MGHVIGMNTMVERGTSRYFGVPIDVILPEVECIQELGSPCRNGTVGLSLYDEDLMSANLRGMIDKELVGGGVLRSVQNGGPAELKGLRPLAVVTRIEINGAVADLWGVENSGRKLIEMLNQIR